MSFFAELRRRNVLRVAAAYVVSSWLVIQVVETLFPVFGLSDAAIRIVVIVLAIGFVPVVILAWAFELTPEGLKPDKDVNHSQPTALKTGKKLDRVIMVVLALSLGYFAIDKFVLTPQRQAAEIQQAHQEGRSEALVESYGEKSIAVLPFVNMSSDTEQEYFSDGISEELLNLLARIPELRVISRSSAFSYKGKDIKLADVARELNVAHILEGSVRKAGDRVRITAQLIEARSDTHLWSQTYDRTLDDVFAIQDEIAADVVEHLQITLLGPAPTVRRTDTETYALTLQARQLAQSGHSDALEQAVPLLKEALSLDPLYVPAWTGLANIYYQLTPDVFSRDEGSRLFGEAIQTALSIDPNDGVANSYKAWILVEDEKDLETAALLFQSALEAEPGNTEILRVVGVFAAYIGHHETAITIARRSVALDPLCFSCLYVLSRHLARAGRLEEAEINLLKYMILSSGGYYSLGMLQLLRGDAAAALVTFEHEEMNDYIRSAARAIALHDLGRQAEFEEALANQIENWGEEEPLEVARVYGWVGDGDGAFEWLDKAFGPDARGFFREIFQPYWTKLHNDPRWLALREKAGLSAERLDAIEFDIALPE
jgi:adenylate cyclase